jgi:phage tail sheath protein FI
MPEYLSPGVYVEEISTGPKPIEGVSTSTTGFVGQTERGPLYARLVTSWLDFQRWYGGHVDTATTYTAHAVKGFFDNGGQRAFIARVVRPNAGVPATLNLPTADAGQELRLDAIGPGEFGNRVFVRVTAGTQLGFRLTILYYRVAPPTPFVDPLDPANLTDVNRREPDATEDYDNLGLNPNGPRYAIPTVNAGSQLVEIQWLDPAVTPALPSDAAFAPLVGGADGDPAPVAATYIGADPVPENRHGLALLEQIDEISLLVLPDEVHPSIGAPDRDAIRGAVVNQCEILRDRFAILQIAENQGNVANVGFNRDTSFAAIYYPWIRVYDPELQDAVKIPPSGHMAGIYARTDVERGVHKAPANAVVRGILAADLPGNRGPLEYTINKGEHDILNPQGVNVIRDFRADGRGVRAWGARTMSSDAEWKYVNVRRLFLFVEESIDEGTQFVVFEPNHEPTWAKVSRSISNFLIRVWRSGALAGVSQEEAFFVKCDRTTMTQDDIDNGRLICYIGIAPVKPAEFVIFRISQKTVEAAG